MAPGDVPPRPGVGKISHNAGQSALPIPAASAATSVSFTRSLSPQRYDGVVTSPGGRLSDVPLDGGFAVLRSSVRGGETLAVRAWYLFGCPGGNRLVVAAPGFA